MSEGQRVRKEDAQPAEAAAAKLGPQSMGVAQAGSRAGTGAQSQAVAAVGGVKGKATSQRPDQKGYTLLRERGTVSRGKFLGHVPGLEMTRR